MQNTLMAKALLLSAICLTSLVNASAPAPKKDTKSMESKTALTAKIGIIETHRIVTEDPELLKNAAPQWQEMYAKIQDVLKPLNAEFEGSMNRFNAAAREFETMQKSGLSSQDAMKRKYDELMAARNEAAQAEEKLQRARYDEGNKAQAAIKRLLDEAVDAVTTAQGWDFIIMKDALANKTVAKRFDVTDEVLAFLRKKHADQKAQAPKKS